MYAFDFISLPPREEKPRERGLTFVLDKGMSCIQLRSFVEDTAPFFDLMKFGWGTSRLFEEQRLKEKIHLLRDHDIRVCPGGTLMELAVAQNCVDEFLHETMGLGFNCVEVSDGTIPMTRDYKLHLINTARKAGLGVVSEIGKKSPAEDKLLGVEERIAQAASELEAGSWKVIIEGRESGTVGVYDAKGHVHKQAVEELIGAIGLDNIVFEAPQKSQQAWFFKHYGNTVSVGNIPPADVIPVETLRHGLRGDTLKEHHFDMSNGRRQSEQALS
jgi:phosphosulfolactate synthase